MKKLTIVLAATLLGAAGPWCLPTAAAQTETAVAGAAAAIFPSGTSFNGIPLSGSTFGKGVLISSDGSAVGDFQTLLAGTSLLGTPQDISLVGKVSTGTLNADGSATFEGVSIVDLGNGLILTGVPFSVTVTTQGLELVIGDTALPAATVTEGSITIQ